MKFLATIADIISNSVFNFTKHPDDGFTIQTRGLGIIVTTCIVFLLFG